MRMPAVWRRIAEAALKRAGPGPAGTLPGAEAPGSGMVPQAPP
jgi:hypothetical protein